ncbi:hypothetical protein, partial [uncultured Chryseobacterium sp.]|uniref:hypothetical protein n=1 Tax=uncultured Chryseobacterium sp. TaxID=259322 RepID=UPI0025EC0B90
VREESKARNQESRAKRPIENRRIENRPDSRLQTSDIRYQISDIRHAKAKRLHLTYNKGSESQPADDKALGIRHYSGITITTNRYYHIFQIIPLAPNSSLITHHPKTL